MTREEIIQGLQFTIDMFLLDPTTGETYTEPRNDMDKTTIDACRGAIKLLEQETVSRESYEHEFFLRKELDFKVARLEKQIAEQEPCEDAVSRAEVLKGYIEVGRADGLEIYSDKVVPVEYINNLPPVTPTRKVGKWIYKNGAYICPFCGHQITGREEDLLYCCKCGERMKGVEDGSN